MNNDRFRSSSTIVRTGISRRAALSRLAGAGVAAALVAATRPAAGLAQATPAVSPRTVNHFALSKGDLQVLYDTSSFGGLAQLSYRGPIGSGPLSKRPIDSVTIIGDQIESVQVSNLGELVPVYLDAMPDAAVFYLTLLLPSFFPSVRDGPSPITGVAILTTFKSPSFGAPAEIVEYAAVELDGTAAFVIS